MYIAVIAVLKYMCFFAFIHVLKYLYVFDRERERQRERDERDSTYLLTLTPTPLAPVISHHPKPPTHPQIIYKVSTAKLNS